MIKVSLKEFIHCQTIYLIKLELFQIFLILKLEQNR